MPHPETATHHRSPDLFGLTETEQRYYQISHARLLALLHDPQTTVHRVTLDHNNYGDYLFITLSRTEKDIRRAITFYGLGYHRYREAWVKDTWHWYEHHPIDRLYQEAVSKDEALVQIEARHAEIAQEPVSQDPSDRAVLFALLGDLADDDFAQSELEDWDL